MSGWLRKAQRLGVEPVEGLCATVQVVEVTAANGGIYEHTGSGAFEEAQPHQRTPRKGEVKGKAWNAGREGATAVMVGGARKNQTWLVAGTSVDMVGKYTSGPKRLRSARPTVTFRRQRTPP